MGDGHSDDALEFPFAPELSFARGVVAFEYTALVAHRSPEGIDKVRRQQLTSAESRINAFAGKWIEEVGGIPDNRCSGRPAASRSSREWSGRPHRGNPPGADESGRQMRSRSNPVLEERGAVIAQLLRALHRNDYGNVHNAAAYVDYAEVAIVVDVHLAHIGDALDPGIMRDQRYPPRPDAIRLHQAKTAGHHRAESIRSDDVPRRSRDWRAIGSDCDDAGNTSGIVPRHVSDSHTFLHPRAGISRPAQNYFVEDCAADGQPLIAKCAEAVIRSELAVDDETVGRAQAHARQVSRSACLYVFEDAHVRQDARGLWAQILSADFVSWKCGAIQHQHVGAFARERPCGGGAGGPSPDDNYFRVQLPRHSIQSRARRAGTIPCIASGDAADAAPTPLG